MRTGKIVVVIRVSCSLLHFISASSSQSRACFDVTIPMTDNHMTNGFEHNDMLTRQTSAEWTEVTPHCLHPDVL